MFILSDLWFKNVPFSERRLKWGQKQDTAQEAACKAEQILFQQLNKEQKRLLDDYDTAQAEAARVSECEAFVMGFRIGARIMLDVLNDSDTTMHPLKNRTA